jgi:hypothetical protein
MSIALLPGVLSQAAAASSYVSTVLADAPVGYWRIGEPSGTVMNDSSGNARHGTYIGAPTLGVAGAVAGDTAAVFAPGTRYGSVPDNAVFRFAGSFTLEAWVRRDVAVHEFASAGIVAHWVASGDNRSYALTIAPSTGIPMFNYSTAGATWSEGSFAGATALTAGVWQHVVVVFVPSSRITIYLNGVIIGNKTSGVTAALFAGTAPLWVAMFDSADSSRVFPGAVDEVAVYNTALSEARIIAHYTAVAGSSTVIYEHNFIGVSIDNLVGVTVSYGSGTHGGSVAPAWVGFGNPNFIKADGSVLPNTPAEYSGAFLPFVPEAGNVYWLQAHIYSTVDVSDQLFLIGFTDGVRSMLEDLTSPWASMKSSGVSAVESSSGSTRLSYNATTIGLANPAPRDAEFIVELDTLGPMWVYRLYLNGVLRRSFTYSTNPTNITHVSIGMVGTPTGRFENFKLIKRAIVL